MNFLYRRFSLKFQRVWFKSVTVALFYIYRLIMVIYGWVKICRFFFFFELGNKFFLACNVARRAGGQLPLRAYKSSIDFVFTVFTLLVWLRALLRCWVIYILPHIDYRHLYMKSVACPIWWWLLFWRIGGVQDLPGFLVGLGLFLRRYPPFWKRSMYF